jgi:glutaredoxin 3
MDKQVVIYSTPTCHFCQMTKQFLADNKVEYTDYDVSTDEAKRNEMIEKSGQMGVPVVFIGDEMLVGFDENKLKSALGL